MNYLFAVSLLSTVFFVHARCPIGTVQGVNAADCYLIDPTPTMWLNAEESCIRLSGHLTSVSGAIGNAVVRQIIGLSNAKEFWLGGSWDTESPRQWTWTDGRRFSYTNWASGQPLNRDSCCTAMDVASGSWYSRMCQAVKPFVCKVPPLEGASTDGTRPPVMRTSTSPTGSPGSCKSRSAVVCPRGWNYVAAVEGKCLRTTDKPANWHNSRATCKQWGGDLISVHSDASDVAISEFVATVGDSYYSIGLQKHAADSEWQWADGSPVNYTNWQSGFGDRPTSAITLLNALYGTWEDIPLTEDILNQTRWRGICQTCPS